MHIRQPRSTALIFRLGKIVIAGTKNVAKISCKTFVRILIKISK